MKKIINDILPPVVFKIYKYFKRDRKGKHNSNEYGWFGNYKSWSEAMFDCENKGYASKIILQKVKRSLLKVKKGEAVYERDSYLFDKIQYSWPLLAGLLGIASRHKNRLNVVDFGGSLGSSYFQNRLFLNSLNELRWNIVEQKHFVDCGKKYFENGTLNFFYDIDSCLKKSFPNIILLSGVLQYLENPYDFLKKILDYKVKYIIIDRTAFLKKGEDRLTIQKVPPEIYNASYPSWFFNERNFLSLFKNKYKMIADFSAHEGFVVDLKDTTVGYKGFIFEIIR
jgi:putative methyltransferase (TIGR04325 family)